MSKIERRFFPTSLRIEQRESNGPLIRGYAAVFNQPSRPIAGMFIERIAPGAFAKTLAKGADVRALVDHDPARIIGRSNAGTLAMREDEHGLYVEIVPPDTTVGRDVVESIRRGDLDQMSFGFKVPTGGDSWDRGTTPPTREVREAELFDVSVVAYPAYEQTSVAVRSMFPDGVPERVSRYMSSTSTAGACGPAPKELHAFIAWSQERTVAANERRICLAEELEKARMNAELRLSAKERRERWIRETMAKRDADARAYYRRVEEERRREFEGRCKAHSRFSCRTCFPPSFGPPIIIS